MRTIITPWFGSTVLAALLFIAAPIAGAGQGKLLAVDPNHVAIKGYDTVAYFTDGKAVKGSSQFEYVYDDARWQFSNAAHRRMFVADPDRYMPQYGGYCAACVAMKECAALRDLAPADPEAWAIVDGKLYMVVDKKFLASWKAKSAENIRQANIHWVAIQRRQTVQRQ
jgi:hypothetical protein